MQSYQGDVGYEENEDFQTQSGNIASNIKKISQNVSSMTKMVQQLQTPQDSQELRNQLRQIQNYTQKMAKDTSIMIMDLMKVQTDSPSHKMARERLSEEYMATLNGFQTSQRLAAQKTKEEVKKVKAQSVVINIDPYPGANNAGKELVEMSTGAGARKQEQLNAQAERSLQELEQRERDVQQLESDILAVNDIFKDLGTLIHTQGAAVDSIESHVEYAAEQLEGGVRELGQAATLKNKLRKRKVYIAIILTIIVCIILIILFNR